MEGDKRGLFDGRLASRLRDSNPAGQGVRATALTEDRRPNEGSRKTRDRKDFASEAGNPRDLLRGNVRVWEREVIDLWEAA